MIAAIRAAARGRGDGARRPRPVPGRARTAIPLQGRRDGRPGGGRIEVDLRDNPDCLPCGLNLSEATRPHRRDDRRLQQHRPRRAAQRRQLPADRRCCCARTAASASRGTRSSCSLATTNLADRVVGGVQRAHGGARATGSAWPRSGSASRPPAAVISGHRPARGDAPFINQLILRRDRRRRRRPHADGWLTRRRHRRRRLDVRDSVEMDELRTRSASASSGSFPTRRARAASAARPRRTSSTARSTPASR